MASRVEDKYCVLCKLVRERGGGDFEKNKKLYNVQYQGIMINILSYLLYYKSSKIP